MRSAATAASFTMVKSEPTANSISAMACLPEALAGRRFYEPKAVGTEAEIKARLERMREARKK